MFTVVMDYDGNTAVFQLPSRIENLRDNIQSIGYTAPVSEIKLSENEDYEIKLYTDSPLGAAVQARLLETDTLTALNELVSYLDRGFDQSEKLKLLQDSPAQGISAMFNAFSRPKQPETDKLVLHARLVRKQPDFTPEACIVEHCIPLPSEEFYKLRNFPLYDHPLIEKYYDNMYYDEDNNRHCILVYDAEQGDGLLIDASGADYVRYAQYIPNAKLLVEQHEQQLEQTVGQDESPEISDISM